MIECSQVRAILAQLLDGANMTDSQCGQLQEHFDQCPSCRSYYELDGWLKGSLVRACACQRAPERLRASIMTSITQVTVSQEGQQVQVTRVRRQIQ